MQFPIYKTKIEGESTTFDLNNPKDRKAYFELKAGPELVKLRNYIKNNTFVAYLLGKKNSGKGTYSKLFMEALGEKNIGHVAVGDIVRDIHKNLESEDGNKKILDFLAKNYRGFHSVEKLIDLILGRSQSKLIPSELIITLLKYEINKRPKQTIFIDGFPRAHDQINYSIYLRDLIGYRDDPDFFVFIDVPDLIIDERIKFRVVCPICHTPRNLKLLPTKNVGYDKKSKTFYLMCDNPTCNKARMVPKEGDELGIEPIRARLEVDNQIFQKLLTLTGIPKIYLRNSIPKDKAKEYVDDYEITPQYSYKYDQKSGRVEVMEKPWIVKNNEGVESISLLPPAVVISFIKQTAQVLGL
ncbi:MAG: nucleoside monophosphate kinase [Patescibacteria group bacterium]